MQVILLERIKRLGELGAVVEVKGGFARNFLIPQKKALRATEANKKLFEARRVAIEKDNNDKREQATLLSQKLANLEIHFVKQASDDGRLFGGICSREIASEVSQKSSLDLSHKHVILEAPIKTIGAYTIALQLHPDVSTSIIVRVGRTASEAANIEGVGLSATSSPKLSEEKEAAAGTDDLPLSYDAEPVDQSAQTE